MGFDCEFYKAAPDVVSFDKYEEIKGWGSNGRFVYDWFADRYVQDGLNEIEITRKDISDLIGYCVELLNKNILIAKRVRGFRYEGEGKADFDPDINSFSVDGIECYFDDNSYQRVHVTYEEEIGVIRDPWDVITIIEVIAACNTMLAIDPDEGYRFYFLGGW